jgi:hypothetical protein
MRDFDTTRPNVARVYDFALGGKDNFAADREAYRLAMRVTPDARESALMNRAYLRRVVRYLVGAGVRQLVDFGSGLPTQGNVHEVAQSVDPSARVVYVDIDPMVLAHARALLATSSNTCVIQADIRAPDTILDHPTVRRRIDFDEPVGLLLFGILHHVNDDEDPAGIAARLCDAACSGSYLALSHFHNPGAAQPDVAKEAGDVEQLFNDKFGTGRWRTHEEIRAYFGDLEIVEPGLVPVADWRPDACDKTYNSYTYHTIVGGVGRKR